MEEVQFRGNMEQSELSPEQIKEICSNYTFSTSMQNVLTFEDYIQFYENKQECIDQPEGASKIVHIDTNSEESSDIEIDL